MSPAVPLAPGFLALLRSGELLRRADALEALLAPCRVCPWECAVDRLAGETKVCVAGRLPIVASHAPHFGEEPALSGTCLSQGRARGAGNVFLGHCNLRCVYCQNGEISQNFRHVARGSVGAGLAPPASHGEVTHERLAEMMLELQAAGCHNIGFVSPTHFAPQIVRALVIAADRGLALPLVYNTNAYDSLEVLRLLEGVIDVYLPDLKYADDEVALEVSKVRGYVGHARAAIEEMHRQVGDALVLDDDGLVRRGLVIRLLVLPNDLAGLRETLTWIRDTLGPRVTLSVMSQYYPAHRVDAERTPLLARTIRPREFERVLEWIDALGFENGWIQPLEDDAAAYYRPDFSDRARPFKDARDFETRRDA